MTVYRYGEAIPEVHESVYVADNATVIGDVVLHQQCSIWYQAVLRADNEQIEIGARSNIQDGAVLHADPGYPLNVGRDVTVGHQAMLHGCTVGDGSLVGIQAVILNGVVLGKNCLVGAGALLPEGKTYPDNSLIIGTPGKVVRELSDVEISKLFDNAQGYVERAQQHKAKLAPVVP